MSSSHQFAIMSLHVGQKIIMKCVPIIYYILQYRQLTLERAPSEHREVFLYSIYPVHY